LDAEEVRQELLGVIAKAQAAVYEIGYLTLARRLTPDQGMEKLQELQDIAERMMGEIGLEPPTPPDPS
jgi:hypothetical protein